MLSWKIAIITLMTLFNTKYNIYSETMVVVEQTDSEVICVDFNGYEWSFAIDQEEDWYPGDIASCVMCDNGTELIYDDEILAVQYCGWIDGNWGYDCESNREVVCFDKEGNVVQKDEY